MSAPLLDLPIAVIVVWPTETASARPVESIVAICAALDVHVTLSVMSSVNGAVLKVPMARNCAVPPTTVTIWGHPEVALQPVLFGITVIDTRSWVASPETVSVVDP
jgi:hypothetical protein